MSDGFDKEAEREKLREKLADDEEKREHTQRMSELLLKGATMTNRHCEDCGDPIFRHDGREFCPSCGNEAGNAARAGGDAAPATDGTATDGTATGSDAPPRVDAGADANPSEGAVDAGAVDAGATTPADTAGGGRAEPNPPGADRGATGTPEAPSSTGASPQSASRAAEPQRPAESRPTPSRSGSDVEGVAAARASLTRTLNKFARAAEETDDPRRARDHLEAAREAAETLAALDG
ncbi:Sjogren's syndrome/scleroderma autoantigen 1 family protein [Halorubrum ejinorense]|uniref:Sjogren's syndrome/scleroderma autoantigen 1 family protein n=1 Tax=Halorubrum ejinorense TaxID=425309 RepID=A0AAV3SN24_9EURY